MSRPSRTKETASQSTSCSMPNRMARLALSVSTVGDRSTPGMFTPRKEETMPPRVTTARTPAIHALDDLDADGAVGDEDLVARLQRRQDARLREREELGVRGAVLVDEGDDVVRLQALVALDPSQPHLGPAQVLEDGQRLLVFAREISERCDDLRVFLKGPVGEVEAGARSIPARKRRSNTSGLRDIGPMVAMILVFRTPRSGSAFPTHCSYQHSAATTPLPALSRRRGVQYSL